MVFLVYWLIKEVPLINLVRKPGGNTYPPKSHAGNLHPKQHMLVVTSYAWQDFFLRLMQTRLCDGMTLTWCQIQMDLCESLLFVTIVFWPISSLQRIHLGKYLFSPRTLVSFMFLIKYYFNLGYDLFHLHWTYGLLTRLPNTSGYESVMHCGTGRAYPKSESR